MYQLKQHKNLSREKWFAYPREQQLLMIANELNRAKNWIEKGDSAHVDSCYDRALELTDLTSEDKKWHAHGLREMRRFREILAQLYIVPDKDLKNNTLLYNCLLQMHPGAWNLLRSESTEYSNKPPSTPKPPRK